MNETMWIMLAAALSGAWGRLVKLYPELPKGLVPWLVLVCGYGVMLMRWHFAEGLQWNAAALAAWDGLAAGLVAIGGHEALKPALRLVMSDEAATKLLGKLPKPAPKADPGKTLESK